MNNWSTLFVCYIVHAQAWMQVDVGTVAATKDVGVAPQPAWTRWERRNCQGHGSHTAALVFSLISLGM